MKRLSTRQGLAGREAAVVISLCLAVVLVNELADGPLWPVFAVVIVGLAVVVGCAQLRQARRRSS